MIKEAYESGELEVNNRVYKFLKMNHGKRLKVFGYASSIQEQMVAGEWSFLGTSEWAEIQKILFNAITYEGSLLSKLPEENPAFEEDYLKLIGYALSIVSYPFMRGVV